MKISFAHPVMRFLTAAAIALSVCLLAPFLADSAQNPASLESASNRLLARRKLPGTNELQLIIQLEDPSVVEWIRMNRNLNAPESLAAQNLPPRLDLQSSAARAHRERLAQVQGQVIHALAALDGIRIEDTVDTVLNAVIARVPVEQYASVRTLPGVKKVHFSRPQRLLLDAAATLHNAQGLWDKTGGSARAGQGIKIGIIDSGIDITHPMFANSSLVAPQGYPKGETAFTNGKVIAARNYVNLLAKPQAVRTAVDEMGHGTYVSAIAAGQQVTAPLATISGMAPGAYLGMYKVFGTPGINESTTTAAILAAINGAVTDGMDILSLSLGGLDYSLPAGDPEITALENAVNAGIVVVVAAGNDGPSPFTISTPGSAPNAITVGSVSNSRTFAQQLRATAPTPIPADLRNMIYYPGDGPAITNKIPPTVVTDVQTIDGTGQACSASAIPSGSLSGKIAFILRGSCSFAAKVTNVTAGGAVAALVYNHDPASGIVYMGELGSTRIPAVMISNADGLALKDFLTAHPGSVQVEIDDYQTQTIKPTASRVLSYFSSVGPAPGFGIKPDLVAVGENVYSAALRSNSQAFLYDPTGYTLSEGTSVATPIVAGAAAGIKQLFPGLSALAIKSLLTTTTNWNLTAAGLREPYVIQAGSGLLDMGRASAATAVVSPTNLNFGYRAYSGSLLLTRALAIRNISSTADEYTLSIESIVSGPTLTLDRYVTESVPPAGTANVNLSLQIAAPLSGGFQGFVLIRSSRTSLTYRVPYWAGLYVPDSSRTLTVSRNASGPNTFANLSAALKAAQPGNIVEIADSSTYPAGILIGTNAEGLPLNGITLRAAAGQSPILDGTGLTEAADVQIIGVQNVLLQGLHIRAGTKGVQLYQPGSSYPVSATIDHCTISNNTEGESPSGVEIVGGGSMQITYSTISGSAGPGIMADDDTYLTLLSSAVQNNQGDGIDATYSNIDILNSQVSNNTGPGLLVLGCVGTIDGSTFSGNRGAFGDGIEIADGNFTVTKNTFDSNERFGIGFFSSGAISPGSVVNFTGNTVRSNKSHGVVASPALDLRMEGNLINDNGGGIRLLGSTNALLVNNLIVRSTGSTTGNGIEVAGRSKVRLANNTIYKNVLQGIVLSTGASVSVVNSIVDSNDKGDIEGVSPTDIQFSLVRDRTLASGNNITGDPKFANPDAGNFNLLPGSPAIDTGSNSTANLPFLDFQGRLRVATSAAAGALSGEGTVDMGAMEANSTYPLLFPLLAQGSQAAWGDRLSSGVAVLNYGDKKADATFTAFNPSGSLMSVGSNPVTRAVNPQSQIPILAPQLFGFDFSSSNLGGVLATSLQRMAGFFLVFDQDFNRFADGVSVSDWTATDFLLMRHQSDSSGKAAYVLFNPGVNQSNITAALMSSAGTALEGPKTATLAPKGQLVIGFNAAASTSGYVRVLSDRPITGMELFGNSAELSALGAVGPGSEARLYFPHVAANGGFSTLLGVINTNSIAMNVILRAYGDDGRQIGTPVGVTLRSYAQLLQPVSELFKLGTESLVTGYVIAEADQAGIQGFTAFRFDDGTRKSSAAMPAESVPHQRLLFSHIAHQTPAGSGGAYQTGVALLNPFGTPISYTFRVFDSAGNLSAEMTEKLGPYQKVAKLLSHPQAGAGFFMKPLPLAGGHIEVSTDYALLGFELFFTEDLSQLAAVPAQIPR